LSWEAFPHVALSKVRYWRCHFILRSHLEKYFDKLWCFWQVAISTCYHFIHYIRELWIDLMFWRIDRYYQCTVLVIRRHFIHYIRELWIDLMFWRIDRYYQWTVLVIRRHFIHYIRELWIDLMFWRIDRYYQCTVLVIRLHVKWMVFDLYKEHNGSRCFIQVFWFLWTLNLTSLIYFKQTINRVKFSVITWNCP
jgi:hypothetical protein